MIADGGRDLAAHTLGYLNLAILVVLRLIFIS